jgi:2-polyprenyl-6-methoxyphenol hydroxylase-like FAD-dependent oxidoreductase
MKALIIGGGVAGPAAALAFRKIGWEAEVYEAYGESAGLGQGAYLTIAVNGIDALRAVDAAHVVTDSGFRTGLMEFYSGTGKLLGSMPMGPTLKDAATYTIRRSELYAAIAREARERGAVLRYDTRLVGSHRDGSRIVVEFAGGSSATGDILVGADGVRSTVRPLIDADAPGPRYTGLGNTGGFARVPDLPDAESAMGNYRMVWGRKCFFGYTIAPDRAVWWFANPASPRERTRDELRRLRPEALKAELVDLLRADKTPGARIVSAMTDDFGLSNQYDLPRVPRWHDGPAVIIGDAAHAVSPASGQGASMAIEDAVVLAQCVRDTGDVEHALDRYEKIRRPRVEAIVAYGSSMNNSKRQGVAGRLIRDLMLPMILKKAASPAEASKLSWMFGHHIEWDARVPA